MRQLIQAVSNTASSVARGIHGALTAMRRRSVDRTSYDFLIAAIARTSAA